MVWIQDYQLQLVPGLLRSRRPDLRIGFFNHIPFPGYEIYSQLPWRRHVVEGLLGADLLGFQRRDDAGNFLRACRRLTGASTRGSVIEVADRRQRPSQGQTAPSRVIPDLHRRRGPRSGGPPGRHPGPRPSAAVRTR